MIAIFFLTLLSVVLPPMGIFFVRKATGKDRDVCLPLILVANFGCFLVLTAASYGVLPFGWTRYLLLTFLSPFPAYFGARYFLNNPIAQKASLRSLLLLGGMALLFTLDVGVISARQGWHFLAGAVAPGESVYFQAPFNHDVVRNLAVLNALLRGNMDLILPNAPLNYQMFWFHFAATFVSLFRAEDHYYYLLGVTWASAVLVFFGIFWAFYEFRGGFRKSPWLWVPLAVLFCLHADIYNTLVSLARGGRLGIEADLSYVHVSIYRYPSLKFIAMIAPQHAIFMLFLSGYLVARKNVAMECFFFILAFLASPIHAAFVFPFLWAAELLQCFRRKLSKTRWALTRVIYLGAACLTYFAVLRTSPISLFLRKGVDAFPLSGGLRWGWLLAPAVLVASFGVVGILASALTIRILLRRKMTLPHFYLWAPLMMTLVFNFVITSPEIKRHANMISYLLLFFFVLSAIPRSKTWRVFAVSLAGLATVLHAYFLYCYLGKPSRMPDFIAWKDYFAMNRIIRKQFPGICVVGAVDGTFGLLQPISMEATTTFAHPEQAYILSKVNDHTLGLLKQADFVGSVVPYARAVGCPFAVWGPMEQILWGPHYRDRFFRESDRVARSGSVSLYRLSDKILDRYASQDHSSTLYLSLGKQLFKDEWYWESLFYLKKSLELEPNRRESHLVLSQLFEKVKMPNAARAHAEKAKQP